MKPTPAEAAREKLAELLLTLNDVSNSFAKADAILAAFPQLAPGPDVLAGARELLKAFAHTKAALGPSTNYINALSVEIAAFAAAHAAAERADEREACCKIVCQGCRDGLPFSSDQSGGHLFHVTYAGPPEITVGCSATAIRARKP